MVVFTLRLPVVVVSDTVNKDHQHCPRHKEKRDRRKGIHNRTDLKPGIAGGKPVERASGRIFRQCRCADRLDEYYHRTDKR